MLIDQVLHARLLIEEQSLAEEHATKLRDALGEAFHAGTIYFRGGPITPRESGGSFATALHGVASRLVHSLYPHFCDVAITEAETAQLLEKDLHGPSPKFLEKGLGILALDAGKYEPTCAGVVPQRVLAAVQKDNGISGERLLKQKSDRLPSAQEGDHVHVSFAPGAAHIFDRQTGMRL